MLIRHVVGAVLLGIPIGFAAPADVHSTTCETDCRECGEGGCRGARACKKMKNACSIARAAWACTKVNAKGECVRGGCHKCLDD